MTAAERLPAASAAGGDGCAEAAGIPSAFREMLALVVPLGGALAELVLSNSYHRVAGEVVHLVYLAAITLTSLMVACFTARLGAVPQGLRATNRLIGFLVWAWIVWIHGAALDVWVGRVASWLLFLSLTSIAVLAWLAWNEFRWRRVRPALLLAAVLFVGSQPLLAKFASSPLGWPEASMLAQSSRVAAGAMREGTVVVLLDELNARDGHMLAKALVQAGMNVVERNIAPVANSTAKVIPQIWTGRPFPNAKACSSTAICSGDEVLDFAKVQVSRPDVDVVGFFHPYCAMQGLRFCARVSIPLPIDDIGRLGCAAARRLGIPDRADCKSLRIQPWIKLQDGVIEALWQAPFWQRGGLMYAHLPLPHPPGRRPDGTLREHYEGNLQIAQGLLREMARRVQTAGFQRARLVVFSDHPLRQTLHCAGHAYRVQGCKPDAELQDEQVPLIVASFGMDAPNLSGITTNAQVFSLMQQSVP